MSYGRFYSTQILGQAGSSHLNVLISHEKFWLTKYYGKPVVYFLLLMSAVDFDNGLSNED